MSDAIFEATKYDFSPSSNDSNWEASWEVVKFDWFMKLYIESKDDDEDDEKF